MPDDLVDVYAECKLRSLQCACALHVIMLLQSPWCHVLIIQTIRQTIADMA